MSKPWDYLIEGDAEIRDAERSGDVDRIIKAYKRAGQAGGGASAFGRAEIGGWNRRAAKGFKTSSSAIAFINAALDRNYAILYILETSSGRASSAFYLVKGKNQPRRMWFSTLGANTRYLKVTYSAEAEIRRLYDFNVSIDDQHRLRLRLAVIPYNTLPPKIKNLNDYMKIVDAGQDDD